MNVMECNDFTLQERDREERGLNEDNPSKPRVGHTVYVYGYGISEDLLRSLPSLLSAH